MSHKMRDALRSTRDDALSDVIGGVWLVTLLLSLMQLPSLLA